jgi:hypothetical protein
LIAIEASRTYRRSLTVSDIATVSELANQFNRGELHRTERGSNSVCLVSERTASLVLFRSELDLAEIDIVVAGIHQVPGGHLNRPASAIDTIEFFHEFPAAFKLFCRYEYSS